MGNLPAPRVSPSFPFASTGVDYCGPFHIKQIKFRNRNTIKVYVSIFVCFTTKACHIEVVHDLTSEAFIAALERFFARRGASSEIYSAIVIYHHISSYQFRWCKQRNPKIT